MPRRWRTLDDVSEQLPCKLPVMAPRIVRVRVPREANNAEGVGVVHLPPHQNQFPHPDPRAQVEPVLEEVAQGGPSLNDDVKLVQEKINEVVASNDPTPQKLNKLRNDIRFLKKAALAEQFEQHFE